MLPRFGAPTLTPTATLDFSSWDTQATAHTDTGSAYVTQRKWPSVSSADVPSLVTAAAKRRNQRSTRERGQRKHSGGPAGSSGSSVERRQAGKPRRRRHHRHLHNHRHHLWWPLQALRLAEARGKHKRRQVVPTEVQLRNTGTTINSTLDPAIQRNLMPLPRTKASCHTTAAKTDMQGTFRKRPRAPAIPTIQTYDTLFPTIRGSSLYPGWCSGCKKSRQWRQYSRH